mmetsp:Transcript_19150/g.27253  ORF Transcript_19150/g.27253 Transcript_19150/m.27253 type:complete len:228 (-) Transcript_19150:453-1136(-)
MGMIFGKIDVAEPAFKTLLSRAECSVPYDIRSYGKRFAIETEWTSSTTGTPFFALAKYIGVIGEPQNEGSTSIAMTAPVVMENVGKGQKIAMTAPVVMEGSDATEKKRMQFILPAEFDDMAKIPKPTNPNVTVKEIDPAVGAVHKFSGSFTEKIMVQKAKELASQLREDGAEENLSDEEVIEKFQFWGYNPPYTIPFLRRNEVWIELSKKDLEKLLKQFGSSAKEDL